MTTKTTTNLEIDCAFRGEESNSTPTFETELYYTLGVSQNLTSLNVTSSPLVNLSTSGICLLTLLRYLTLQRNPLLTALPIDCLRRMTNLAIVDMNNNQIREIPDGLFAGLQQLQKIVLDSNPVTFLGIRNLAIASDLKSLTSFEMSQNSLTFFEPWPVVRARVIALQTFTAVLIQII